MFDSEMRIKSLISLDPLPFYDLFTEKLESKIGIKKERNAYYKGSNDNQKHIYREIIDDSCYEKLKERATTFKKLCIEGTQSIQDARKSFVYNTNPKGRLEDIPFDDPIHELANSPLLLEIISKKFKLKEPKPYKGSYWWIPPVAENSPRQASQNWHIDPEGIKVIKLFIYFNNVSDSCMQMIPSVRRKTLVPILSKMAIRKHGLYPNHSQLKIIEKHLKNTVNMNVNEGGFILVDTSHLHRGGYSHKEERLSCYVSFKPNR